MSHVMIVTMYFKVLKPFRSCKAKNWRCTDYKVQFRISMTLKMVLWNNSS